MERPLYSITSPDILREIARYSPTTYRRLAETSRKVQRQLTPVLRFHCDQPISAEEIRDYLVRARVIDLKLIQLHPYDSQGRNIKTVIITPNDAGYVTVNIRGIIKRYPRRELLNVIKDYFRPDGYPWLPITVVYNIYVFRGSCNRIDPGYAIKRSWQYLQDLAARVRQIGSVGFIILGVEFSFFGRILFPETDFSIGNVLQTVRQQHPNEDERQQEARAVLETEEILAQEVRRRTQ